MREYRVDLLERSDFGGFWQRVLALLVDTLVLWLPSVMLAVFLGAWLQSNLSLNQSRGIELTATYGAWVVYSVCFWSSRLRATPGKKLLGLVVIADDGCPVSVGRSFGRVVSQFVSGLVIIGPLLAIGSERRQALHDLLAGTLVVKVAAAARLRVVQSG